MSDEVRVVYAAAGLHSEALSQGGKSPWDLGRLRLLDSDRFWVVAVGSVERGFELGGRDVVEVAVEPLGVVPVDQARAASSTSSTVRHGPWSGPRMSSAL
jgi:hypothetical protein